MKHLWAGVVLLFTTPQAWAAAVCTLTVSDLTFGEYSLMAGPDLDSMASITVDCSNDLLTIPPETDVSYSISISAGMSGTYGSRAMSGPSTLNYNLYTDANRTIIWGDGSGSTMLVSGGYPLPGAETHTAFGRIPAGQTGVAPGSYNDTLSVTVTY